MKQFFRADTDNQGGKYIYMFNLAAARFFTRHMHIVQKQSQTSNLVCQL